MPLGMPKLTLDTEQQCFWILNMFLSDERPTLGKACIILFSILAVHQLFIFQFLIYCIQ